IETSCRRLSCVHPKVCDNLVTDHGPLLELLASIRKERTVKRAFIASGVRYDLAERSPEFVAELARHHTGGQLSVAPEHNDPQVLKRMKKPGIESYERFADTFCQASDAAGKEQYLIPYFITGHPGSTFTDTIALARYLKRNGIRPRQIQDFIPTPMAVATAMYHTGIDPLSGDPVPVVRDLREKRMLKALILWWDDKQWPLAREALKKAGRKDLIGRGPECLVPWGGGDDSGTRRPHKPQRPNRPDRRSPGKAPPRRR
ncbi:MAG TPA: DUF3362 domain-containing protein, partial [Polyangiaceae bacterium]